MPRITQLSDFGFDKYGERKVIPYNIDDQIVQSESVFPDIGIPGAKIENLTVNKLLAGSMQVDQYMQSTGFVTGVTGWIINGDGTAEFQDVIAGSYSYNWTSDLVFTATDYRIVAWTSGTITRSNGDSFSLDAGNTGAMAALTYIYLDTDVSETVLQISTTFSDAIGAQKNLIATVTPSANTSSDASIQVFGGRGGVLLDGSNLASYSAPNASRTTQYGVNYMPSRYSDFENFPVGYSLGGDATTRDVVDIATIAPVFGTKCLRLVSTGSADTVLFYEAANPYNISLETNTKYIISFYARSVAGTEQIRIRLIQSGGGTKSAMSATEISNTSAWTRYQAVFTTNASGSNNMGLLIDAMDSYSGTTYYDGFQLELASSATSPEASYWRPSSVSIVGTELDIVAADGTPVLKAEMAGANIGDLTIGDYDNDVGMKYDKSGSTLTVAPDTTFVTTGSSFVEEGSRKIYQILETLQAPDGATSSGDYLYISYSSSSFNIARYDINDSGHIDLNSGTDGSSLWVNDATWKSLQNITAIGSYIYGWCQKVSDSVYHLVRVTIADGTITQMTISGTAPSNAYQSLTGDGTYLYISADGLNSATLYRYTVSGTTATYSSTITMPDYLTYLGCDGTYLYNCTSTGGGVTIDQTIYKSTLAGVEQNHRYLQYANSVVSVFVQGVTVQSCGAIVTTSGAGQLQGIKPFVLN
jgi:hypothetical protein